MLTTLRRWFGFTEQYVENTFEDRHAGAAALAEFALDIFEEAKADLEAAAASHASVAVDIKSKIAELEELYASAVYESERTITRARKLSDLTAA